MHDEVLNFWFNEISPEMWWKKDVAFDAEIKSRFLKLHKQASKSELFAWRNSAESALAEVIVLDQFSRNIYRDTALAFANDTLALALAQSAIEKGFDAEVSETQRSFFYLSTKPLLTGLAVTRIAMRC